MLLFKQVFAKYAYLREVNTNAGFVLHQCEETPHLNGETLM